MKVWSYGEARDRAAGVASRWRSEDWYDGFVGAAPGPVAHEVATLGFVIEADAGGALFQLRDTVETALKLATLIFASDLRTRELEPQLRAALFAKPLALGDWADLSQRMAQVIAQTDGAVSQDFATAFLSRQRREITQVFVGTRNNELAHGAFRNDPLERLEVLETLLFDPRDGVAHLFALFAEMPWPEFLAEGPHGLEALMGAETMAAWHEHCGLPETHPAQPGECQVRNAEGRTLSLAPYVTVRKCSRCQSRDIFLFDTARLSKMPARYDFLDYVQGHKDRQPDTGLDDERVTTGVEAQDAQMERGLADRAVTEGLDSAVAAVTRYVPPTHLRDPVTRWIGEAEGGTLTWVQAPAHTGKSIFARSIADTAGRRDGRPADPLDVPGLIPMGVFIQRFWRSDDELFAGRLLAEVERAFGLDPDRARSRLPRLDPDASDPAARSDWLLSVIATARQMNPPPGDAPVLLVIDGLDELTPEERPLRVLDMIPTPERLPSWLHVVITSRRPEDTDCPAWIGTRLGARLTGGDTNLLRVDAEDEGYRAVLRDYADRVLGRRLDDAVFAQILDRAEGLFLFVSFLVEQLAFGRLALDGLGALPKGEALFVNFLNNLRRDLGGRRLQSEAEEILLMLAAEERAHAWQVGEGLDMALAEEAKLPGMADRPPSTDRGADLLTDEIDWRGLPLDLLAQMLDRDRGAELDSVFLYAVYRLKATLGVDRGGSGAALYRLWLKDLAQLIATDPDLGPRLPRAHARAARFGLEARSGTARTLAHAVLSQDGDLLKEVRDGDHLLEAAFAQGTHNQNQSIYVAAIRHWNTALTLLFARRTAGTVDLFVDDINLAVAFSNRANAKAKSQSPAGALSDHDTTIIIMEAVRDTLAAAGHAWPHEWQNDLASAFKNRAVAKVDAKSPSLALDDYNKAIALGEALRDSHASAGNAWPTQWQNDLATAYMNRANAKRLAQGPNESLPDHDAAIDLMEAIKESLASEGQGWTHLMQNNLASAYMNRAVAKSVAIGQGQALPDYDAAVTLMETLRYALEAAGNTLPPQWQNDLAAAYMNRAVAKRLAQGPAHALPDYNSAIAIMEKMRDALINADNAWPPEWQNNLAGAYMNRAVAMVDAHGPKNALPDYDNAISQMEALRDELTNEGRTWPPKWQELLAGAFMNRAIAKSRAKDASHAMFDFNTAIEIRERLRSDLIAAGSLHPPEWDFALANAYGSRACAKGEAISEAEALHDHDIAISRMQSLRNSQIDAGKPWPPAWQIGLARSYSNRAVAKRQAQGPAQALPDYDAAITLMESLRDSLSAAAYPWPPEWRNDLAAAYMNRANTKRYAQGSAQALPDYDAAITIREALRDTLEVEGHAWPPQWQNDLATAHMNRAIATLEVGENAIAKTDLTAAHQLSRDLVSRFGDECPKAWRALLQQIERISEQASGTGKPKTPSLFSRLIRRFLGNR